jgi:uncharacterized membrane protein YkgB
VLKLQISGEQENIENKMENLDIKLESLDQKIIYRSKRLALPFARIALFVVYFWFGSLKVFGTSPANPLVSDLLSKTMPGLTFATFIIAFGVFEMVIGLLFIIPRLERLGVFLLAVHMITTIMPLFLLCSVTWNGFLTPTLEGQYIIKNILIIALAVVVLSNLQPLKERIK